jgi:hypothetical protein
MGRLRVDDRPIGASGLLRASGLSTPGGDATRARISIMSLAMVPFGLRRRDNL